MAIEIVTGISSAKKQYAELIIPVTDLRQASKKQVEQNQGDFLQRGATSEKPPGEERGRRPVDLEGLPENLEGQVKQANQLAESLDRSIRFFMHEDSGRPAVNVVDNNTHKVIKTVPPEQFLNLVARVKKVVGIFLDEFV